MEKKAKEKLPDSKKSEIKLDKGKHKELYWIIGTMIGVIIILLLAPPIFRSFNTFVYNDMVFTKENFDQIPVYHYYYYWNANGKTIYYNAYFRIDPRENDVPISGEINYHTGKAVYISINTTGLQCPTLQREVATLTEFISSNQFPVRPGTPNKEEAEENKLRYVTCDNQQNNTVILLQNAADTSIEKKGNCHIVSVSSCEDLLPAVEKFKLQSIIDAKNRAKN